ncbi:putative autophagy protein [Phaeoacremonium minimum UCRPA7]|uniref:Putative autophagy protein n=1 Tax=Phaeoacremonium minimum (strain UCR-PA7) TaxID=1286976 RepID=R8BNE7_PHAM7|nr:putative autophagy protein [Phaeoacremonium minimum UCRPA7]EOO00857.1 putative autophagy protein [Phaeoacremonium minimum UCRPA7]
MLCQKCRGPLRLDNSLEDLNPAAYDLLVAASSQQPSKKAPASHVSPPLDSGRKALYERASKNAAPAPFRRHAGAGHPRDSSAMSFVLLTESQVATPPSLPPRRDAQTSGSRQEKGKDDGAGLDEEDKSKSYEMERITKLFEILSARSDIDHPVCVECTDILLDGLQKRLETAARERDAYVGYLKKLQAEAPTEEELRAQEEALARTKLEESGALEELLKLEKEKASLDEEILALEEESRQLDAEEEQFWRDRNSFATKLTDFQNERDSINSKFDHDSRLLEKLQRSNVYNDTFCISHDGTFATINGLRLGRLSNKPVDWPEINAAWGHALLLLVTVADKLRYKFDGFEPQPMGSTSRIIRYDIPSPASSRLGARQASNAPPPAPKKHVLELFSSGDMPLGLTFMHRRFDNAMVAFLELVRQLGVFVQRQTAADGKPLSLPYRIEGDRIGDVSIKLGIAQDDGWTKACKLTLTCCKFLLAHASNVNAVSNGRGQATA